MSRKEYIRNWKAQHYRRDRMHKMAWYYKNRTVINLMFSKASSIEPDEADKWYAERHPEG